MKTRAAVSTMLAVVMGALAVQAATVAYWRFEEGTNGMRAPVYGIHGNTWYIDSSGNGNTAATWDWWTSPAYTSDVPAAVIPQTGQANALAIWCGGGDPPNINDDIYTLGHAPISSHNFSGGWTVEFAFKTFNTSRWQVYVGKDGKPSGSSPFPPLAFKHNASQNKLEMLFLDGSMTERSVLSTRTITPNRWYVVAGVCDGSQARLYMYSPSEGDTGYVLEGTIGTVAGGALVTHTSSWTIGRGYWNGGTADWVDGVIDEVRISDTALSTAQFLGVIPEPAAAVAMLGLVAVMARRK